jgi:pilus assembly protein CpaE
VDLHLQGGTAAMMLGAKPGAGLRLALEDPERADALFIDRVALPVEDRLRLIAAEEPFDAQPRPTPEALQQLLDLLRQRFNHIVLDLPVPPDAMGRQALASSALGVIVLGPDLAGLRDAEAMRKLLATVAPNSQPILLLNRANAPGALPPALVREGLGRAPDATIPNLPRDLPRAANLGRPALKDSAAFRKALAPLTREVSGTQTEAAAAPRLSLLRKLLSR